MSISAKTRQMLWGFAAARCAFPDCRKRLFMDASKTDDESLIGEECHIIARAMSGPRGKSKLTSKERDEYENLILLCRIHHKQVDDQRNTYTVERLKEMKAAHEKWVQSSLQSSSTMIDQELINDLVELKRSAGHVTERLCGYGSIMPMEQDIFKRLSHINDMSGILLEHEIVVQPIRDFATSGAWFLKRRKEGGFSGNEREKLVEELDLRYKTLVNACNQLINNKS